MTLATAMRDKYLEAEAAILLGKSIQFNGRTLTMENLAEIRSGRREWEGRAANEAAGKAPRIGGLGFSVARMD
ncbi:hypothetical protein FNU76_10235 [Chitinimonas arctica]|uniref:Primosomal replication protein PriB/PriC domain protein n=1 Tax=Chitinimonas arctica TaxID=2594795 RepID=A0A516SEZ6_9NEIS|nr:hypothetical protein [Chitinimonas arctica]QDQ26712.1 hypothetical protein FNU76_10235 [Chitinimonas arctica]